VSPAKGGVTLGPSYCQAIDFDKRMNKGYITLNLEESLQEEVFELTKTTVRSQRMSTTDPLCYVKQDFRNSTILLSLFALSCVALILN
jgi:hypothetical protein